MKQLSMLLTVLVIFFSGIRSGYAQSLATVKGKVTGTDGHPVPKASVFILKVKRGTSTSASGEFQLEHIRPGEYVLRVTAIGYSPLEKNLSLTEGANQLGELVMNEKKYELRDVTVKASKTNKFTAKRSETVAKMPLENLENPQVYSSISKELIEEQIVTDYSTIMNNSPGVYRIASTRGINTGGGTFYTIRGFLASSTVVDGVVSQTNYEFDPANIEKVEVMKGPSGAMYGGGVQTLGGVSYGGIINMVTKKPLDTPGGEVAYTGGSFALNRLTADVYGPLDKNKQLLFRVNAAYQYQNSFQDAGFRQSSFISPALEYRPNKRLSLEFNGNYLDGEATSPLVVYLTRTRPLIATAPDQLNFDWNRSYLNNDVVMKNPTFNLQARSNYQLSNSWNSQTIVSYNDRRSDGYYHYLFLRSATTDDQVERNMAKLNSINTSFQAQQNFNGDFRIAGLRNRTVAGLDYLKQTIANDNSPYVTSALFPAALNGQAPDNQYYLISPQSIDALIAARVAAAPLSRVYNYTETQMYGAYVSNMLNITEALMAMLSLRVDRFESNGTNDKLASTRTIVPNSVYSQTSWSPKFGLIYQVLKNKVSLFGNYMNGFTNLAPVTQPINEISGVLKPQHANQLEAGVKTNLFKDKLNFSASYYKIEVDNMTFTEPITWTDNRQYTITVQNGTQRSEGLDLETVANPIQGLNLVAGYSYNDSKFTQSVNTTIGRRPNSAGPQHLVNFWASYLLQRGKAKGLGIGIGGNYAGKHLAANTHTAINGTTADIGVFTLPAYTLIHATAFYDVKRFRIGLKANNITDKAYFFGQGVITPNMGRNYAASLSVKF